jgi:DNA-binding HxlR family transcriptional regulator
LFLKLVYNETMTHRTYNQYCPLAHALDLVGERWTLLIIRNLFAGPKRFSDLLRGLPGIGSNILTARLKSLEENGLVQSRFLQPPAASSVYELTPYGRSLENVMVALALWGGQSLGAPKAGQVFSTESIAVMLHMLFMPAVTSKLSGIFAVKIEDEAFNAKFWVKVHDAQITVEQEAPGPPNLTLRADLMTLELLATGQISYNEAVAKDVLRLDGSEAEIANFLAHFVPV